MEKVNDRASIYRDFDFVAVDNIIDMKYSDAVLPRRAIVLRDQSKPEAAQGVARRSRNQDPTSCREPEQQRAPAHAQGGRPCQNIRLLHYCAKHLVKPQWNILTT